MSIRLASVGAVAVVLIGLVAVGGVGSAAYPGSDAVASMVDDWTHSHTGVSDHGGHSARTVSEHEEGPDEYRLANSNSWDSTDLDVLIVLPVHGPIANTEDGVLPEGVDGAAPGGAYLEATLHFLSDWQHALETTGELAEEDDGPAWAQDVGWVSEVSWETHVVSEDVVTHEEVRNADIVKFYTESTLPVLGAAVYTNPCLAYSTKWNTYGSMTYVDMYNLAGHELLHCFGMSHPVGMQPVEDVMSYEDTPWADYRCPSNLNVRAAAAAFAGAAEDPDGVQPGQTVVVDSGAYEQICEG